MNRLNRNKVALIIGILFVMLLIAWKFLYTFTTSITKPETEIKKQTEQSMKLEASVASKSPLSSPLEKALERITKKPFGIKISPENSPVSPENFSGFHTGADFEIFNEEKDADVPVFAVCDGKILLKKSATGYGGVLVQECKINNEPVTVVYGHIKLASIDKTVGDMLNAEKPFAILGTGFSAETSGERKHLHLGIHKGTKTNILGYVQKQEDLTNWIDFESLIK